MQQFCHIGGHDCMQAEDMFSQIPIRKVVLWSPKGVCYNVLTMGGVHTFFVHRYGALWKLRDWWLTIYLARETFFTWPVCSVKMAVHTLIIHLYFGDKTILFFFWWLVIWVRAIWWYGPVGGYILPLTMHVTLYLCTFFLNMLKTTSKW